MNKYQEALEFLCDNSKLTQFNIGQSQWASETLQELVDKATPKTPLIENMSYICCPNCLSDEIEYYDYHHNEVKLNYCNRCGQAIDWSEDESK